MSTHDAFPAELHNLYVAFVEHLLSLPETATVDGAVEWLAERMLFGLPDAAAYTARTHSMQHPRDSISAAVSALSFPDTDVNEINTFYRYMIAAQVNLESAGLPGFPRIEEVRKLYEE